MQSKARVPEAGGAGLFMSTGDSRGLASAAGTFLVQPENAEDFGRALAGEPTDKHDSADISF